MNKQYSHHEVLGLRQLAPDIERKVERFDGTMTWSNVIGLPAQARFTLGNKLNVFVPLDKLIVRDRKHQELILPVANTLHKQRLVVNALREANELRYAMYLTAPALEGNGTWEVQCHGLVDIINAYRQQL